MVSSSKATSARAPAVARRASSPSAPTPGTSSSPTSGRRASTWPSPRSTVEILGHHAEAARVDAGPERCLDRVETLFERLLGTVDGVPGNLWGIGIGVPGPVEFESGRPISPPIMPGWDGYPVRERFAARYRAPVWVDNDVNLLALGRVARGRCDRP